MTQKCPLLCSKYVPCCAPRVAASRSSFAQVLKLRVRKWLLGDSGLGEGAIWAQLSAGFTANSRVPMASFISRLAVLQHVGLFVVRLFVSDLAADSPRKESEQDDGLRFLFTSLFFHIIVHVWEWGRCGMY